MSDRQYTTIISDTQRTQTLANSIVCKDLKNTFSYYLIYIKKLERTLEMNASNANKDQDKCYKVKYPTKPVLREVINYKRGV